MAAALKRKPGRPRDEGLRERRREEILDAAAGVFARHGYPGTDLQFVADKLGISKGTVYRYFASKEALFLAAVDRGLQQLINAVEAAASLASDPLDRVARAIRAYLTFFRDHATLPELLIQERAEFRDRAQSYFVRREAGHGKWDRLFAGLIADGQVRDIPPSRVTDVIGDLLYGTMFTNHFSGRHKPLEEQAEDILDVVLHGILTDAGRGRLGAASRER